MHLVSSATMSSDRHPSAHAVHAWAHTTHASMHAVGFARSTAPRFFGYVSSISVATDTPTSSVVPALRRLRATDEGHRPHTPLPGPATGFTEVSHHRPGETAERPVSFSTPPRSFGYVSSICDAAGGIRGRARRGRAGRGCRGDLLRGRAAGHPGAPLPDAALGA